MAELKLKLIIAVKNNFTTLMIQPTIEILISLLKLSAEINFKHLRSTNEFLKDLTFAETFKTATVKRVRKKIM